MIHWVSIGSSDLNVENQVKIVDNKVISRLLMRELSEDLERCNWVFKIHFIQSEGGMKSDFDLIHLCWVHRRMNLFAINYKLYVL